ncbi:MAG: helix-turn-helix domain-containing protein [Ilumatobacteraceae bacterium]
MSSADRRTQLLDVAADIVSAGGERALTIEAVVAKAEVHRPIVYRHFENAEALLDGARAGVGRAAPGHPRGGRRSGSGSSPPGRGRGVDGIVRSSPLLMSIVPAKPSAPLLADGRRKQQNAPAVKFLVGELVEEGLTGTDAEIVAVALFHALSGIVQLWGEEDQPPRRHRSLHLDRRRRSRGLPT